MARQRARDIEAEELPGAIYQAYEEHTDDWRRGHLGASLVGHRCDRYLWLSFRWAAKPDHDGKLLRLFERGQREEDWVIRDLERTGLTVTSRDEYGEQIRISEGHLSGSVDGLVEGVPGNPDTVHVLEIKTSNRKSFDRLKERRVRSAQPRHFVQMQIYMDGLGLEHALYLAVCKDSDEIYVESVPFDQKVASKQKARAKEIIESSTPPARLDADMPPCVLVSKDGTRWPCQYLGLCHGKAMPQRHCRTCVDATPGTHGKWSCGLPDGGTLSLDEQKSGCGQQLSIPPIVNAEIVELEELPNGRDATYQFSDGSLVTECSIARS